MRASRSILGQAAAVVAGLALAVVPLPANGAHELADGADRPAPLLGMDRPGVIPGVYLVVLDRAGTHEHR